MAFCATERLSMMCEKDRYGQDVKAGAHWTRSARSTGVAAWPAAIVHRMIVGKRLIETGAHKQHW